MVVVTEEDGGASRRVLLMVDSAAADHGQRQTKIQWRVVQDRKAAGDGER